MPFGLGLGTVDRMDTTTATTTDPIETDWDVIIVGRSFAGLSAALTLGRARRSVLVVGTGGPRNEAVGHAHEIRDRWSFLDLAAHSGLLDSFVAGDRVLLSILCRNLVENAARHARSRLKVHVGSDGDLVLIRIADDGPGVPQSERERIFDRFFRGESATGAMLDASNPRWGPLHAPHHWGESIFGYYLTSDAGVLRKHAQMLGELRERVGACDKAPPQDGAFFYLPYLSSKRTMSSSPR